MKKLLFLWIMPLFLFAVPDVLSTAGVNATSPQIAIAATTGDSVCTWIESGVIQSRTKAYGGIWNTMLAVPCSGVTDYVLATDDNGNATVLWVEGGMIYASTKSTSGTWEAAKGLSSAGASSPNIDIDNSGNIVAVWTRSGNIESATKLYGQLWSDPDVITATTPDKPVIAIGGNGSVMAMWHGYDGSYYRIYEASKPTISGSWTTQSALTDTSSHAMNPSLDLASNGDAAAVWYRFDLASGAYSNVIVQLASKPVGANWEAFINATEPSYLRAEHFNARIHYDDYGDLIGMWVNSYDGATFTIEADVKASPGGWSGVNTPIISVYSNSNSFDVASHGDGDVTMVTPYYNPTESADIQILSCDSDIGSYRLNWWSIPVNYSIGSENGNPTIQGAEIANTWMKVLAWESAVNGVTEIHSVTTTEDVLLPPTNGQVVQNTNNFHVFTEYYNVITWSASPSDNIAKYSIFRDGHFLDLVDANTLSYTDHNQGQNVGVTYWVCATQTPSRQSSKLVITYAP